MCKIHRFNQAFLHRLKNYCHGNGPIVIDDFKHVVPADMLKLGGKPKKTSAVLVPLCNYQGRASILFTVRSSDVSTHKGQVAFPGGHAEPNEHPYETATREAVEELGPLMGNVDIIGECMQIPSINGNMVTPVIGYINQIDDLNDLTLSEREVSSVFVRSISDLLDPSYKRIEPSVRYGRNWNMPVYGGEKVQCSGGEIEKIWGLSAWILEAVLEKAIVPNIE